MAGIGRSISRARLLARISAGYKRNIAYSNNPGFEGSPQALILANIKVYEAMVLLSCPEWAIKGDKNLIKYFKKFKIKVPEYDFGWLQEYLSKFWDAFRFVLLDPKNSGLMTPSTVKELRSELTKVFEDMPPRFQYKSSRQGEAVDLMLLSLQLCLDSDNQLLANPIFEIVLLLWYHYLDSIGELKN